MKKIAAAALLSALLMTGAAHAEYKYAAAEGEYMISLPDAPIGETIWAQNGKVPLIDDPPKYGAIGEYALLKRIDPENNDLFEVRVTFVKASRDFLLHLTEAKIKKELETALSDIKLQNSKFSFSGGTDTLKWGTISGFSVSQNNDIFYNIAHYLVGQESVMLVKIGYSVQNETFNDYYKQLAQSITYMGR